MKFRRTRLDAEREVIAREYTETVEKLINSKQWADVPPPEDQLPNAWMPPQFLEYWLDRYHIK